MKLYSPTTNAFYEPSLEYPSLPADVVEVPDEEHARIIDGQGSGKRIAPGPGGMPVLVDVSVSDDELSAAARADRDGRLAACDWVVLRASESGKPVPTDWAAYRQGLRDVPSQKGFPRSVKWPTAPGA